MANVSSQSSIKHNIRSISLPSRRHIAKQRVDEELKKLKLWEETSVSSSSSSSISAGDICYGLSGLQELFKCTDDFLNLPSTMEALFCKQIENWVDGLLDKSVRILDICSTAKDMVSNCKENVRDLQSSLRRRKGTDTIIVSSITKYFSSSRKMKKEVKRSLASLKQTDASAPLMVVLDDHVLSVIRILQEVNSTSISTFQAILRFLSSQSYKQKINKWTTVARLVLNGKVNIQDQQMQRINEIENVETCLHGVCVNAPMEKGTVHHIVQKRLQILEGSLEGLEKQLEAMFRCMIKSRTTLLNVLSS